MYLDPARTVRVTSRDELLFDGGETVLVDGTERQATAKGGTWALSGLAGLGMHELVWGGVPLEVEVVGAHYATRSDLEAYGSKNGDGFADRERYTDSDVEACIQAAEESVERGCRRSFVSRAIDVRLGPGLNELPVVDARELRTKSGSARLVGDRQAIAEGECDCTVVYGSLMPAKVKMATIQLAASYLRPRSQAENVRGQSSEGVYISYTLATGGDGSWTGLPLVDAVIEEYRSRRMIVA